LEEKGQASYLVDAAKKGGGKGKRRCPAVVFDQGRKGGKKKKRDHDIYIIEETARTFVQTQKKTRPMPQRSRKRSRRL